VTGAVLAPLDTAEGSMKVPQYDIFSGIVDERGEMTLVNVLGYISRIFVYGLPGNEA
jgi:hypothetical protein